MSAYSFGGSAGTGSWGTAIVQTAQQFRADHGPQPDPGLHTETTAETYPDMQGHALHSFGAVFAETSADWWSLWCTLLGALLVLSSSLALLGAGTPGPTGEDFTIGARELSRQACRPGVMAANSGGPSRGELAARHIHLALRATSPDQHRGWLAVMKQLNRTARAIHAAQEARGQLATARQTYANVVGLLEQTHAHTEAALDPERQRIQAIRSFTTEGRPKTNASTPEDTATVQEQKARSLDGQDPLQAQRRAPDLDRRR